MIPIGLFLGFLFQYVSHHIQKISKCQYGSARPKRDEFQAKSIVDCWFFGKILLKPEITFFTRVLYIKEYISTAYIDVIVTFFFPTQLFPFILYLR